MVNLNYQFLDVVEVGDGQILPRVDVDPPHDVSNPKHDARREGVQLVQAADDFPLEIPREMILLSLVLGVLLQLLHYIQVFYLRPDAVQPSKLV